MNFHASVGSYLLRETAVYTNPGVDPWGFWPPSSEPGCGGPNGPAPESQRWSEPMRLQRWTGRALPPLCRAANNTRGKCWNFKPHFNINRLRTLLKWSQPCFCEWIAYLSLACPPRIWVKQYPQKKPPRTRPESILLQWKVAAIETAQTGVVIRAQYSRQVPKNSIAVHFLARDLQTTAA